MNWHRKNIIIRRRRWNIMVILKNIKKVSDSISADYYPEGKEPAGFMKIRIPDGKIVEHENASMFAAPHVRRELKRIVKMDNPPKEKTVIWY